MKKFLPILMILIFAFTACTDNTGFAGKYAGTFTFIKDSSTKSGTVVIATNPLSTNSGLLLYGCLPLEKTSANTYLANSNNIEFVATVLESIIGHNNYVNTAEEAIKNIKVEASFTGNTLNMTVYYEIQILSTLQTRVEIIKFSGAK